MGTEPILKTTIQENFPKIKNTYWKYILKEHHAPENTGPEWPSQRHSLITELYRRKNPSGV